MATRISLNVIGNRDYRVARRDIQADLNKFGKSCSRDGIPDATLPINFLSVAFAGVAPDACEILTVILENGSVYWSFDEGANWLLIVDTTTSVVGGIPSGGIILYTGTVAGIPANFLVCNGQAVSRTTFSGIFDRLGVKYGVGDGSTTFNLPDYRGGVGMGGNYAGLPNGENLALDTRNQGTSYGVETVTLTLAETATHTHSANHDRNGNDRDVDNGGSNTYLRYSTPVPQNTGSLSGDNPHDNVGVSLVTLFLIKA